LVLFKAYTVLRAQNRGHNLLQCGSEKRAREHSMGSASEDRSDVAASARRLAGFPRRPRP